MKKILVMAFASIAMLTATAGAAPLINGTFSMSGASLSATNCATSGPLAAGDSCVNFTVNPVAITLSGDGDFSGANTPIPGPFGSVTLAPLQVNTTTPSVFSVFSPANVLLFTFTNTGFAGPSLVTSNGAGGFNMNLTGFYSQAGFADTDGTLNFTFQPPISTANGVYTFSASGSTIPEPSTYAMLGSALLGLGLLRRRKA